MNRPTGFDLDKNELILWCDCDDIDFTETGVVIPVCNLPAEGNEVVCCIVFAETSQFVRCERELPGEVLFVADIFFVVAAVCACAGVRVFAGRRAVIVCARAGDGFDSTFLLCHIYARMNCHEITSSQNAFL